jgi:hypothetical protein
MILAGSPDTEESTGRAGLALLIDRNSAWTTAIAEGFASRAYGAKQVAPVVRASASTRLPEESGVLLLPTTRASDIGTFTAMGENRVPRVRGYRYEMPHGTEFLFFAQGSSPWECGPWTSDANLLYCKLDGGRLVHVIMVSGSFAEWRGKRFVSHPGPVKSFEWLSRAGLRKAFSSEGGIPENTVASNFEFLDPVS